MLETLSHSKMSLIKSNGRSGSHGCGPNALDSSKPPYSKGGPNNFTNPGVQNGSGGSDTFFCQVCKKNQATILLIATTE